MWSILICDESTADLYRLRELVREGNRYKRYQAEYFERVEELVDYLREKAPYQVIIILPFHGEGMKRLEYCRRIRTMRPDAQIIFMAEVNAFSSLVYEVEHVYFLLKPIQQEYFWRGIDKAVQNAREKLGGRLTVKTRGETARIPLREIFYMEKELRLIHIHLDARPGGEEIIFYGRFQDIAGELGANFFRCHNSYIVNLDRVTCLKNNNFFIGDLSVPISQKKYEDTRKYFENFFT